MKRLFLASLMSATLIGCGGSGENSDSSNNEYPISTLAIGLNTALVLEPLTAEFHDKYDLGEYKLCWIDATQEQSCLDPIILSKYIEAPTPFYINVYGDAEIYFTPLNAHSNYSSDIKIRDSIQFRHSHAEYDLTLTPRNQDYAGFVVFPSDEAPVQNVFLDYETETGEYKHAMDKDENGLFYAYKNVSNYNEIAKLTVEFQYGESVEAFVPSPEIGKSYKFEIQESHNTDVGVIIQPNLDDLEDDWGCIGSNCTTKGFTIIY
ncbi:hypothetical protein KIT90_03830 [Vibrio sp. B172a]|uniref:hypothetical protein n=1 Tax=Vibrio sp. B172a TaxID=2835790 RepID=UPI002552633B|nr:hypothetical protein [Vibrio sp. B172a]MDK9780510.1 hypothetical protein [Vibrio sp. B172a]